MAREVDPDTNIEVHQAVHGYADGHRQLGISVKLQREDSKLLLILSDMAGGGAKPDANGYLTGFPLLESGYFALARTWAAQEMPRPGCVWTHTLLIRLVDLEMIEHLEGLNVHFRRPMGLGGLDEFRVPLKLAATGLRHLPLSIGSWEAAILSELYGSPSKNIRVNRRGDSPDKFILALWSQQWCRLRRSFRFCSFSARDDRSHGFEFDLQISPASPSRAEWQSYRTYEGESNGSVADDWLVTATNDLSEPNASGLRSFFERVGSDIDHGREAFRPLCTLFDALEGQRQGRDSVEKILVILRTEPSLSAARVARSVVTNRLVDHIDYSADDVLRFLWTHLDHMTDEILCSRGIDLCKAIWRKAPYILVDLRCQTARHRHIVEKTVTDLEVSQIVDYLHGTPHLEAVAIRLRPEILEEDIFWSYATELDMAVEVGSVLQRRDGSIDAMIGSNRIGLDRLAVISFGEHDVLSGIARRVAREGWEESLTSWMALATRNPKIVGDWFRSQDTIDLAFLKVVAECVSENAIPNIGGEDPWVTALRKAQVFESGRSIGVELAVFLFKRAVGSATASAGGLIRASAVTIDRAITEGKMSEGTWRSIERYCPRDMSWRNSNRSKLFRAAVADCVVSRNVPIADVLAIARNRSVLRDLARRMSRYRAGRRYRKKLVRRLKGKRE